MKKLICLALVCTLALAGCAPRGGGNQKGEELGDNSVSPLALTEEEEALLALVGGSDAEYGLFDCSLGEEITGCTIEVLSWEDGAWQTVADGGLSSLQSKNLHLRLGVVLSGDRITVNFQEDEGARYSYAPQLPGVDRSLEPGRLWAWLEEAQALTVGERTPLYLEVYDSGDGVRSAALPDSFFDVAYLNQYDRAYAVAVTLEE